MALVVHRSLRLCTMIVLVVTAFGVWPMIGGHGSSRARAENWVRLQSHLPEDLDRINRYPQQYQRAIYERLTPDAKHRLWQEFLRRQATQETTGTPQRRRFLVKLAEALMVDDFRDQPMRRELRILTSEAKVILGDQFGLLRSGAWQQSSFSAHLGNGDIWESLRIAQLHAVERLYSFVTVAAEPACDCWVQEGGRYDCPERPGYYKYCAPDVDRRLCTPQGDGYEGPCGLYDTRACNGACYYTPAGGGGGGGGGGGCDSGDCCEREEGYYCPPECSSCEDPH